MPSELEHKQDKEVKAAQARQVIDVFHEISTLLVNWPQAFGIHR
jgi:mitotic-spindle organizing protein 1